MKQPNQALHTSKCHGICSVNAERSVWKDMKNKLKFTAIPLSIAQSIALLAALIWFWCAHQTKQSPTDQDAVHQISYNDHGTTRYLATNLVQAKRIALSVGLASCGFTMLNLLYISWRTGRPMREVFNRINLFRSIEIELDEEN
jgi:hypothetical protein